MAIGFKWKRKHAEVRRQGLFDEDENDEAGDVEEDVDWLTATKRRCCQFLEDSTTKSQRLREEGNSLAERER